MAQTLQVPRPALAPRALHLHPLCPAPGGQRGARCADAAGAAGLRRCSRAHRLAAGCARTHGLPRPLSYYPLFFSRHFLLFTVAISFPILGASDSDGARGGQPSVQHHAAAVGAPRGVRAWLWAGGGVGQCGSDSGWGFSVPHMIHPSSTPEPYHPSPHPHRHYSSAGTFA